MIQLLINTQRTGGPISPYTYSKLEKDARKEMTAPNDKYAKLIIGRGKFSETIRRLISLGIIDQVFPCFSSLQDQTYHPKHRDARITPVGRILERLENFERIIQSEIKNMYDTLSLEQQ